MRKRGTSSFHRHLKHQEIFESKKKVKKKKRKNLKIEGFHCENLSEIQRSKSLYLSLSLFLSLFMLFHFPFNVKTHLGVTQLLDEREWEECEGVSPL